ncbi:hypothetical protein BRC77_03820 [Halobacteriales archaeon QH_8_64_26]|nr:MAG: hypothetical protein BRC77_03820 [Halobacteriales archaeon QH_8_64_26]
MDRGQAHTLEGVVAGLVLLSGLVFALQATAVTPLSASTSSQHIENQLKASAEGVLATAANNSSREPSSLKNAILFWGDSDGDGDEEFRGADNEDFYTSDAPSNRFGDLLGHMLENNGIAYNVYVVYQQPDGRRVEQRMIYHGEPSDNAVTASRLVTLYDDDVLHYDADGDGAAEPTGTTIDKSNFYVPDVAKSSAVYNVLEVEVVVWRM